ncbi:hypothetical protein L218DRAFT_946440 [Marasmius fiardii PR-910]|nr:hypothetical protein L218DRAFT_946440 [Marasmius fiardii PR-910]
MTFENSSERITRVNLLTLPLRIDIVVLGGSANIIDLLVRIKGLSESRDWEMGTQNLQTRLHEVVGLSQNSKIYSTILKGIKEDMIVIQDELCWHPGFGNPNQQSASDIYTNGKDGCKDMMTLGILKRGQDASSGFQAGTNIILEPNCNC